MDHGLPKKYVRLSVYCIVKTERISLQYLMDENSAKAKMSSHIQER